LEFEMSDIEKRTSGKITVRATGRGKVPQIEGYAALFDSDSQDLGGFTERIAPGAFEWDDVRALFNHDPNQVLARTANGSLTLEQDDKGLRYSFGSPDTTAGKDVAENIRNGNITQSSFAFRVIDESWDFFDDQPDVRTIQKAEVFDVSPVTYPAYPDTTVAVRAYRGAEELHLEESEPEIVDMPRIDTIRERMATPRLRAWKIKLSQSSWPTDVPKLEMLARHERNQ
jgi:Escherichia/Staphylococcus phage prohead protease